MSSSIFFRFKSRKDALQISFDGTSLSVFEVKREIMSIARLGDGKDFDLDIYTSDTNEVYEDDTTEIPRSTTVLVRRQPAQRPGAGRAARYVTGQMPIHARNARRVEPSARPSNAASSSGMAMGQGMTEEERLQAVMSASNIQLKADLEMSAGKPVMRNTFNKAAPVPDKALPPGYVCHRCGEKGHWIQACPTNTDPNFDGKHKFKRTTGIPRSMLEVVEKPDGVGEDGKIDPSKIDKGLMYTANGEWVRAKVDQASWQKFQDQQNATNEKKKEAAQGDEELRERGLECPIDKRPFADPVKTPCCEKTYCRDCIENAVLDADLACPNCGQQVLLDQLEIDSEAVKKLADFEAEKKNEKVQKETEAAVHSPGTPTVAIEGEAVESKSPASTRALTPTASPGNSRKRPAEEELENNRKAASPAGIKQAPADQSKKATPTNSDTGKAQAPIAPRSMNDFVNQMNAMSGNGMPNGPNNMNNFNNPMGFMPGMPNMPMDMNMNMNMMGMGMPGGMGMGMGMGMPPFPMMNGMGGFPNMNMNMGMNMGMNMNNMNWQQQQPQQQQFYGQGGGMMNGGQGGGGGADGAYFRQPVNPHRHQGKQRRQRSVDYKQM